MTPEEQDVVIEALELWRESALSRGAEDEVRAAGEALSQFPQPVYDARGITGRAPRPGPEWEDAWWQLTPGGWKVVGWEPDGYGGYDWAVSR